MGGGRGKAGDMREGESPSRGGEGRPKGWNTTMRCGANGIKGEGKE